MNCTHCNAPLPPGARFCRVCGLAVVSGAPEVTIVDAAQANQPVREDAPTVPTSPAQVQQPTQPSPLQQPYIPPQWMSQNHATPSQAYQPTVAVSPGTLQSAGTLPPSPPVPVRRKKRRLGRVLFILALLLLVLVAGWFVGLRPYLHGLAQRQVDGVLSNAVNQINPAQMPFIPPGQQVTVPVSETAINNLIVLNTAPSDPVQQIHMTIAPGGMRLDFQVYGFACTVTGVPQAVNGQLVMSNVTVQGIVFLIMSPDELTATLDAHLHDATTKLQHAVSGVILKNHEIDIELR